MSFRRDLLHGIAQRLDAAGVGTWVDSDVAPSGSVSITCNWIPNAGSFVAMTIVPMGAATPNGTATYGLTIRCRVDAEDGGVATDDLTDAVHDALEGLWSTDLATGVHVEQLSRSGTGSTTTDSHGWVTCTEPYVARVKRRVPNHE